MIFGTKPVYRFAVYTKKKLHCLGKSYSFDQPPVDVKQCPVKIINQKAEIFFPNTIFNTFVLSVENNVTVLKSYDDKLTFIKKKMDENILYTVKTVFEDEKTREVVVFEFDDFFPGFKTKGTIEIKNSRPIFHCKHGSGPITLQSNDPRRETEAMLASLDSDGFEFVEINNPIERATVRIIKDLNNHKIVENGHIKGILIEAKDKKINEEINVFVKNVYPGSYCFVEDISPGLAEVELVGRCGSIYKVKYKHFVGECNDRKVKKTMKGLISDIKGSTFKFKQVASEALERTADYEAISVPKRLKVTEESDVKNNQLRAVEYIKYRLDTAMSNQSQEDSENIIKLFKKYIQQIRENDSLSLFYLQYLIDHKMLKESDIRYVLKYAGYKFPGFASERLSDIEAVRMIFSKKKNLSGFQKLLNTEGDKLRFMKENPEFLEYSIKYAYENLDTPRIVVENIIGTSFESWMCYASLENGNYKRNLFRRMAGMAFKKNEMKRLFKAWLEFEETVGGNIEEVHSLANQFVQNAKNASK
ncbi:uncharacterized protein VICG_00744 [Vittaforma corneae ATCC 50505]|uniref:Uncharacterized protein n=1 Tax=Vittaforma corneae (strain ATCC 50505) TaxID=993615 RepID=L2GMJ4_VITCO|nr:uncharacterized protein VICG_00744 [Vittaforma corneae ATCC 50505]ELA42103.1 hypothetical protein VICG_00744 [Vittaforma corneae ATCC 50505]